MAELQTRIGSLLRTEVSEDVGAAELVDRLFWIADDVQGALPIGPISTAGNLAVFINAAEDPLLGRIRILKLVDQGNRETAANVLREPWSGALAGQRIAHLDKKIIVTQTSFGTNQAADIVTGFFDELAANVPEPGIETLRQGRAGVRQFVESFEHGVFGKLVAFPAFAGSALGAEVSCAFCQFVDFNRQDSAGENCGNPLKLIVDLCRRITCFVQRGGVEHDLTEFLAMPTPGCQRGFQHRPAGILGLRRLNWLVGNSPDVAK